MGDIVACLKSRRASLLVLIGIAPVITLALLLVDSRVAVGDGPATAATQRGSPSKARDTTPPSRPTGLAVASVLHKRLTLTWNPSTDNVGVARYDVYRSGKKITTVTTTSASRTGPLTCGASYVFGVVARDAAENSSKKGRLRVSTSACGVVPIVHPYFDADYRNGTFSSPFTSLFSQASPGFTDLTETGPVSGTSDDRVRVAAPPGSSEKAARFELRDADPGWPIDPTLDKSEASSDTVKTFNEAGVNVGDVRWFSTRIWLPYTATEKFEWARGGSNPFTALLGLHPDSDGFGALGLRWNDPATPRWATMYVYGGQNQSTANFEAIKLWQLTDAKGKRVMSNYNRWIDLVFDVRFAPDNTGWLEIWVNGVNVYPRRNRPTMWAGDSGQYLKIGLYKQGDSSFPESGRSVVYFGRTKIGLAQR